MKSTVSEKESKFTAAYPIATSARAKATAQNSRLYWLIGGLAVGASAMFLFDPANGSARRSSLRQGASRLGSNITSGLGRAVVSVKEVSSRIIQPVRGLVSRSAAAPTEYLQ